MKTLVDYINQYHDTEDDTMRRLKKFAQVDLTGAEGLYETTADRWSRNAKHHLGKAEIASAVDLPVLAEGDIVIYNGQQVKVKIPAGPKNTAGIMVEGHLKMVHQSQLTAIEEGVMGGLQALTPLNRMMQLAGLEHSGAVNPEIIAEDMLEEADAAGMMDQLVQSAENMPQYKGNNEAARLYVMGTLLSAIFQNVSKEKLQTVVGQGKMKELTPLGAIGADLIKTAQEMAQKK
jgi:hypothetical protein